MSSEAIRPSTIDGINLFADEPYEPAAEGKAAERAAWTERHGFDIVKPSWNPDGGSRLYLIADSTKGVPLAPIVAALDRLPAPIVEAAWDGESAPSAPIFFSPGTIARNVAAAKLPAPETRKVTRGPRSTFGYVQTFVGPQRRPKGRMPIEVHAQVDKLLKSVLATSYNRVNGIRNELDEWTQREYNYDKLPNEQFFELYYHESGSSFARTLSPDERTLHVGSLEQVKQILAPYYPDSPPLRALIGSWMLPSVRCRPGQADAVRAASVLVRHPALPGDAVVLRIEPLAAPRPFGIHR
jgi:hypothetical protein